MRAKVALIFEIPKVFKLFLATHGFSVEIKHIHDFLFCGRLVDTDIAYFTHQSKIDDACTVLLVVRHEFIEAFVLFAIKYEYPIVLLDELNGLSELVFRESYFQMGEIQLAHNAPCYSIAV